MPAIVISAVITDGASVLLEAPSAAEGGVAALPRYSFADGDESIEEALAAHLMRDLGIEVLAQDFLDTLYEQRDGAEVVLNNLQLVTAWEGVPVRAGAAALVRVPVEELHSAGLADEVRQALYSAFGVERPGLSERSGEAGKVIILLGRAEEPLPIARALQRRFQPAALISAAALADQLTPEGQAGLPAGLGDELRAAGALTLAAVYSAAGVNAVVCAERSLAGAIARGRGVLGEAPLYAVSLLDTGWPGEPDAAVDLGALSLDLGGMLAGVQGMDAESAAGSIADAIETARIG